MWSMLILSVSLMMVCDVNVLMSISCLLVLMLSKYLVINYSHAMVFKSKGMFLDQLSSFLCMLSIWMSMTMMLAMLHSENKDFLFYKIYMLKSILFAAFMVKDYLSFFMFFELSLMPTLMMMLSWGIQPERIRAGSYLMIYTMVGAMPLLLCMIFNMYKSGSLSMLSTKSLYKFTEFSEYSWLIFFWVFGFLMKLPVYGVHLWLPKAHVEAPVGGSMILAGVLLKLGAYGLLRMKKFLSLSTCFWSNFAFVWFLYSMCMVGLVCFRQSDLKSLVAYSSMAHMSLVVLGVFSYDYIGYLGVMSMLVAHGVCSSGLFFCVQCFYEVSGTRNMILNRGFLNMSPMLCFFWLLLCVSKASAPPSLKMFSEFLLISSMFNYGLMGSVFCFFSVFLAGLFSIYLYTLVSHGKWNSINNYWNSLSMRHCMVLFMHVVPVYFLLLCCNKMFPM